MILFSGCGDERPAGRPPADSMGDGYSAPAQSAFAPIPPPTPASSSTRDPLLSEPGAMPTADPLLGSDSSANRDPLAQADPLRGRTMPTDHSHWLRGRIQGARLTVLLNGVREGAYSGVVDQDITMKLRRGVNTVSFLYEPRTADSSAQMSLLESEHDPPIPPLVSFQSTPQPFGASEFKSTTQTASFFAK